MRMSPTQKFAIINADDFGFSAGITAGIIRAHREGVLTSTTIAANMPAAAESVRLLAGEPALGAGVHLNCTQGSPLSDRGRSELAGDDGQMNFTAAGVIKACLRRPRLVDAIEAEFDAQIRWVLDHGIVPTHLDSHRHSHVFPPIFHRVAKLARLYDIRFIRRCREKLPGRNWPPAPAKQRRTRTILNCLEAWNRRAGRPFQASQGTWGIAHTGLITADWLVAAAGQMRPGLTEIMTHPGEGDDVGGAATRLRQSRQIELDALCRGEVKVAFSLNGIQRIHYGQLRNG